MNIANIVDFISFYLITPHKANLDDYFTTVKKKSNEGKDMVINYKPLNKITFFEVKRNNFLPSREMRQTKEI